MKSKIIVFSALFAAIILLSINLYDVKANNLETDFVFDPEKGIITDYIGTSKTVVIPDTIQGVPVKEIGNAAFRGKALTSVTIPEGVTHIQDHAFSGNTLSSVVIPKTVKVIGVQAFSGNGLTNVTLNEGLEHIGNMAFSSNNISYLEMPGSLNFIDPTMLSNPRDTTLVGIKVSIKGYPYSKAQDYAVLEGFKFISFEMLSDLYVSVVNTSGYFTVLNGYVGPTGEVVLENDVVLKITKTGEKMATLQVTGNVDFPDEYIKINFKNEHFFIKGVNGLKSEQTEITM